MAGLSRVVSGGLRGGEVCITVMSSSKGISRFRVAEWKLREVTNHIIYIDEVQNAALAMRQRVTVQPRRIVPLIITSIETIRSSLEPKEFHEVAMNKYARFQGGEINLTGTLLHVMAYCGGRRPPQTGDGALCSMYCRSLRTLINDIIVDVRHMQQQKR